MWYCLFYLIQQIVQFFVFTWFFIQVLAKAIEIIVFD